VNILGYVLRCKNGKAHGLFASGARLGALHTRKADAIEVAAKIDGPGGYRCGPHTVVAVVALDEAEKVVKAAHAAGREAGHRGARYAENLRRADPGGVDPDSFGGCDDGGD